MSQIWGYFLDFESLISLILYIIIDSKEQVVIVPKNNNLIQIGPILDMSPNYFGLQIHFLKKDCVISFY